MTTFAVVAAVDERMGIGREGRLPWCAPEDLREFKRLTTACESGACNAVIMGRKTWDTGLPKKVRPLPGRRNVVITSSPEEYDTTGAIAVPTLDAALVACQGAEKVFVIGGGQLFTEAIAHPACVALHITVIGGVFGCDTFFPEIDPCVWTGTQSDPP